MGSSLSRIQAIIYDRDFQRFPRPAYGNSKQIELIIRKSLFSSIFCVDYEGYDIFELWTLSGKLYFH